MYVVSMNPFAPDPGEIPDAYNTLEEAQKYAVQLVSSSRIDVEYYVHEITSKPVYKASASRTLTTEVLS